MCGIAGFFLNASSRIDGPSTLREMTNRLVHRGPDGSGAHFDAGGAVGLGHRRLAILDLSAAGHQPMVSSSERYVITYNGEIYNFRPLRNELEQAGCSFRGHSDTEVFLAAIDTWGVEGAIGRISGMFAFALWDREERSLWLSRDRVGKKPLYYGWVGGSLIFGSELAALRSYPGFRREIDRGSLALYMRHNYVPAPHSIFTGVKKVQPGTLLRFALTGGSPKQQSEKQYWSAREVFAAGWRAPFDGTADEAAEALDRTLRLAVSDRMIADVPLGAFLSGGIDSSAVVALMQAQSARPIRTFSIGFHEPEYNEANHAAAVAKHLGTEHTEVYVEPADALAVVPNLPTIFDEPFSDSSQIPTFLVSKIARQHVIVALSGDGGDELFCGYPRYRKWRRIWTAVRWMPAPVRKIMATALGGIGVAGWDRLLAPLNWATRGRKFSPGDKLHKLSEILDAPSPELVYRRIVSHWMRPGEVVLGGVEYQTPLSRMDGPTGLDEFTDYLMLLDVLTYLPDDILVKVDRASMAVSLEARAPLLDHRVIELAAKIPLSMKMRAGEDKWILRQVLSRYVPSQLFDRPKMGFGIPIDTWLRGPLREWAEALLEPSALRNDGYFDVEYVRRMWRQFADDGHPWHYLIWDVLMFQAWLRAA